MKNARNKLAILLFLFSIAGIAQVGIGTTTPSATLDVTAANLTGTTVDGVLIPRVSRLRAQTMTGTPTSTMLYVNDITNGTATGTTINVTSVGFYFFNGTVWEKLASGAASTDWAVTGNSGLSGTTNFLGTTDDIDLAFRRNNIAAGKIGTTSTSLGVNALAAGVATNSVAIGTNALRLTTGLDNVAVGNGTLQATTTGIQNTGVGNAALAVNTGSANTAIGNQAMTSNTSASNGTAVGFQALRNNTTASNNTALGFQALATNTTGSANTAVGFQASTAILGGARNTSIGNAALTGNIAGNENTAVGNNALGRTTGSGNTAMGHEAMFGSASAFTNTTGIGWHALFSNSGSGNTALGYNALQGNATAIGNTAVGSSSLNNNTGSNNTALGTSAGFEHGIGDNNTYIGFEAGRYSSGLNSTISNTFLGSQAGLYSSGSYNTALGSNTLKANAATANNVAIGYNSLTANTSTNNTAIGYGTLSGNTAGTANVALGYNAGSAETGSNKLYIENTNANANAALIYGEFDNNIVRVNGTLQISNPATANGYALPIVRGTNGQILQTDGAGATSWVSPSSMTITETDPQVSSATTSAVPRWNGTTLVDGVIRDDATNVAIGGTPTTGNKLDVTGKTKTTNFQMTNGAASGYMLQSDATGNASWVQNPLNALSMVRVNLLADQVLGGTGWEKINFDTEAFDTGNEFTAGRFTATKAGLYKVNAAYHTFNQSNGNMYSIGIQVNGAFYQITSYDHNGHGIVERSVSCMVQLAVGDYIEVLAEDSVAGVSIDHYSGKTVVEIQQIR
ncbi:beta strand repeat-containing protein [Flavobacterium silvaticum]|uniref:C1q domain-containing protein n=1 Tax=Flavobacterium silvaticum TaxID=1852020 RepID=A0A972FUB2_9FLAO|nr:hypothetical protein [Flavobacterium silvaticum]NMH28643.1 hypothetical protein [Flavobacterium silvaticum]